MILNFPLLENGFTDFIRIENDLYFNKHKLTSCKIPKEEGIYFLYDDYMKLLYIGETKNLFNRISTHRKIIKSSYVRFIKTNVSKNFRMSMEYFYIDYYKPLLNGYIS